VRQAAYFTKP